MVRVKTFKFGRLVTSVTYTCNLASAAATLVSFGGRIVHESYDRVFLRDKNTVIIVNRI